MTFLEDDDDVEDDGDDEDNTADSWAIRNGFLLTELLWKKLLTIDAPLAAPVGIVLSMVICLQAKRRWTLSGLGNRKFAEQTVQE